MHEVEAMVAKLAARLEQNPGDANGWAILARSYAAMQRFPEAIAAYAKAAALPRDEAALLAGYQGRLAALACVRPANRLRSAGRSTAHRCLPESNFRACAKPWSARAYRRQAAPRRRA